MNFNELQDKYGGQYVAIDAGEDKVISHSYTFTELIEILRALKLNKKYTIFRIQKRRNKIGCNVNER
jgi:hypothetical protein